MFHAFFPRPRIFFSSARLWSTLSVLFWYIAFRPLGAHFSVGLSPHPVIGIAMFWSRRFLWFNLYLATLAGLFAGAWRVISRQPWQRWSALGSALILYVTYLQVEVTVGINN